MLMESEQSTLFAEATPASHSATPGSAQARQTTAISGRKCFDLLTLSGRAGCLPKMLLGTSRWASTMCYLTWKERVTPGGRLLFQLAPSMPDIAGIGSGLLPTYGAKPGQRIPTPTAQDHIERKSTSSEKLNYETNKSVSLDRWVRMWPTVRSTDGERGGRGDLIQAVRGNPNKHYTMWPTPAATDHKGAGQTGTLRDRLDYAAERGATKPNQYEAPQSSGSLNPAWVAWLMGFPLDWLDLDGWKNPELEGLPPEYRSGSPS